MNRLSTRQVRKFLVRSIRTLGMALLLVSLLLGLIPFSAVTSVASLSGLTPVVKLAKAVELLLPGPSVAQAANVRAPLQQAQPEACVGNLFDNSSFEDGTFSSGQAFAGGQGLELTNLSSAQSGLAPVGDPTGWRQATDINFGSVFWITNANAYSGNNYTYLTSSGATADGTDACLAPAPLGAVAGLQSGVTYELCGWAADASADGNPSGLSLEVFNNGQADIYDTAVVPDNPNWSDAATTDIPWARYCFNFTSQSTSADIFLSASAIGSNTASLVLDNVCLREAAAQGTLTVIKQVVNDDGIGASVVDDFTLSINGEGIVSNVTSGVANSVTSGTYTVSESGPSNYTATFSGDCNASGSVTVAAGGTATCTITNDDIAADAAEGTITIVKNTIGSDGTFDFSSADADLAAIQLTTTSNTATSTTITKTAGSYTLSEDALTGWSLADIEVAGDDDNGSTWRIVDRQIIIDLDAGENITVTWTNADSDYTVNSAELTGVTTTSVAVGPVAAGVAFQTIGLDFGDLPDSDAGVGGTAVNSPSYNTNITTTSGAIGASHIITPGLYIGAGVDYETDGQPSAAADGDDTNDSLTGLTDDEDGVTFPTFIPGQSADVVASVVNTTGQTAYVYGFIDFDGDGAFTTAGEAVSTTVTTSNNYTLTFNVPVNADTSRQVGARIRLSTDTGLGADDAASDGEVEDYLIQIQPLVNLGNQVWHDYDNDGLLDSNEPGIDSVAVELYQDTDGDGAFTLGVDQLVSTTTTSNGGYYTFTELLPTTAVTDTYIVVITDTNFISGTGVLVEYMSSDGNGEPAPDPDDDVDDDDNGSPSGTLGGADGIIASLPISLTAGSEPMTTTVAGDSNWTVDFGVWKPVSLGNRVWYDLNNNGIQDTGEAGIPGVVLELLDSTDQPVAQIGTATPYTVTTDASGLYTFTNLISGTYKVRVAAVNFTAGGVLASHRLSSISDNDPNDDTNNTDNNGQQPVSAAAVTTVGISSGAVQVTPND